MQSLIKHISVIIPAYNASNSIISTLVSVYDQSYKDYEVIVVNDGSSDNTSELVEQYINENDLVNLKLINKSNGGVSSARNAAITMAKGYWLAFLDADDTWHPKKLEIISWFFEDDFSLIGHDYQTEVFTDKYLGLKHSQISKVYYSFANILIRNRFTTPSVVLRNTPEIHFDEKMRYAEDHDLWLHLSSKKRALFLEISLVRLSRPLLTKGGLSGSKLKMRYGEMRMYVKASKYRKNMRFLLPFLIGYSGLKFILKIFR
ncbi:glycosyltransferase family 2 protein [Pedobacter agri]|uniref:glycosyltransferase family 2 protein n=1 Tax=Pedobacter agri TaxID=454586 RepID=UPI00293100C6|nr:glycosyltransferase family 2 protein [Pedobacter agri]